MKDPEFILLRNRLAIGVGFCIVLFTPLFLFFYNKLTHEESRIVRNIKNEETFFLYVVNSKTPKEYKKEINNQKVTYQVVNQERSKDYPSIIIALSVPESDIIPPALIYIQEGKLMATLNEINSKEEINTFINNFKGGVK